MGEECIRVVMELLNAPPQSDTHGRSRGRNTQLQKIDSCIEKIITRFGKKIFTVVSP
jgi:hypothetical protein